MKTNDSSRWPTAAILGLGTFGSDNPAGRRYHRRTAIALVGLCAWVVLASNFSDSVFRKAMPVIPGVFFLYIIWEFRRYLLALDELARRIQFESIAWTYLTGLTIAMFIGGLSMVTGWRVNPMWFVVLEPLRGAFLLLGTRRY